MKHLPLTSDYPALSGWKIFFRTHTLVRKCRLVRCKLLHESGYSGLL